MYYWFQDLNESGRRWFHFRGSIGRAWDQMWFKYELATGPALSFRLTPEEGKTRFSFGMGFVTLYLTIYGLRVPLLTKGREFGFYWHEWTFRAFFGSQPWESSSSDPWYYKINFCPPDFLFGQAVYFTKEVMKSYSPQHFMFRGKEYVMDSIVVEDSFWFRPRIPFSLYHKKMRGMDLKINNPPRRAGKGENSWDCGDDATYGVSRQYNGPEVTWANEKAVFEYCVRTYCDGVMKDIGRYGRASGDTALDSKVSDFSFIGTKREPTNDSGQQVAELSKEPQ